MIENINHHPVRIVSPIRCAAGNGINTGAGVSRTKAKENRNGIIILYTTGKGTGNVKVLQTV